MRPPLLALLVGVPAPAVGVPGGRVVNPDDWICLRCFLRPTVVAWSGALSSLIHVGASQVGPTDLAGGEAPAICGGEVVKKADAWMHRLRPGVVAECFSTGSHLGTHLVRLGHRQPGKNRAWTGTALCSATYRNAPLWLPLPPDAPGISCCLECERADKERSKRERAQEAQEALVGPASDAPEDDEPEAI